MSSCSHLRENNEFIMSHGSLEKIDSNDKSTEQLLGLCLLAMKAGKRATFLCEINQGAKIVQRMRMKLSRVRNSMDAKNLAKEHFRLRCRVFPYTNARGKRFDCVVLEKIKTREHQMFESLERMMKNGKSIGHAKAATNQIPTKAGVEW